MIHISPIPAYFYPEYIPVIGIVVEEEDRLPLVEFSIR
jgi:hypothetical protein